MRSRSFAVAGLLLSGLALAGCGFFGGGGGREAKRLVCPGSYVAPDADKLAVFKPNSDAKLDNVLYGVRVAAITSRCERADQGLVVQSKIDFQLVANDANIRTGSFVYFVSLVDAQQNILAKQDYTLPFEFDPRHRNLTLHEDFVEHVPLIDVSTGGNYAVVVGLQLTAEQLAFNRAGSRPPSLSVQPKQAVPPKPDDKPLPPRP